MGNSLEAAIIVPLILIVVSVLLTFQWPLLAQTGLVTRLESRSLIHQVLPDNLYSLQFLRVEDTVSEVFAEDGGKQCRYLAANPKRMLELLRLVKQGLSISGVEK